MDGNQFGSTGTYFGDFHDHQAFGDIVHACSAIGFGNVNAKETNIGKLLNKIRMNFTGQIHFSCQRSHLLCCEILGQVTDHFLLISK